MVFSTALLISSILLGMGLAMDAFSVSLANGMNEPDMKVSRQCLMAGTFGFFQALMPMVGWFCVHAAASAFSSFQKAVPWIALILLLFIGGKMLREGLRENRRLREEERSRPAGRGAAAGKDPAAGGTDLKEEPGRGAPTTGKAGGTRVSFGALMIQGVATAIDALSVGFAFAGYTWATALICSLIIAVVTFIICMAGLNIGRQAGMRLSGKAGILGGVILIFIGIEIFVRGMFF